MIGVRLDNRYELRDLLGRGAYGAVYRAHDGTLDRDVAVKILTAPALDAEARDRMLREARAAAALNHPGVVAIYDTGEDQGRPYLVMELIEGKNLRETASLALPELRDVAIQICDALAHAHANGIVHRDLKPENVLIAEGPTVKLADLGIAYSSRGTRLTSDGTILGTAAYLAPEQAMGLDVDGRADLYALGVMLYERLAGRLPFEGDDPLTVISQHLHAPVVPPRTYRPDLPPGLEAIILRLLAKSPSDRFATAEDTSAVLAEAPLDSASETGDGADTADRLLVLDQLARGRLIGRRSEIQQLRELWMRARRGQGHLALISGEPGVGKTRLAHEAIVYAQLNGATVLRGGSYEYEATTPYLPFVEAMRTWVRDQPIATLRELVGDGAAELARFAPEIEAKLGPLPVSPVLPPHEDRLRLFDHVARFFRSLAADGGLLLFLDDLHWADHGTLALLHYLMRDLREAPWLAVATYREVELGRDHPLASSLVEWNRERLATRVSLGRFGLPETSAMLATLFGQETVSPDFAAVIHRETEGNPFFIEEVVKALIEQGQIYREGGEWQRQKVDDLMIPQSIKSAIGHRLERLTPACLEVLHAAAALGKTLAFAELAASVGVNEDALLDSLDEACAAQLMRADPGERFAFTHDKIREVLYEEVNPIRRRRQHQKIGDALEKLYADSIEEHAPDLAFHFTEGGNLEKGLDYSMRAARRAMTMVATDEALGHLKRARDSAEALEDRDKLMEIDQAIGDLYGMRGEFGLSVQAYERVLAAKPNPARRAIILGEIGEQYTQWSDPRAMEYLDAALKELDPATQPAARAKALAMIGRHHHYRAEHRKSIEYYEQARTLAEPIDDAMALCLIYAYLAGAYQHLARFPESMKWAQRCIALGEKHRNGLIVAFGNEFMAEDLSVISRHAESLDYVNKNIEIARRIGSLDRMAWTALPAAFVAYTRGELEQSIAECDRGIELMARIEDTRGSVFPHRMRTTVLTDMDRMEEAKREAELTYELGNRVGQHMITAEGRSALGYWRLAAGDAVGAAALGRETEEACARTDNRNALINMYFWYPAALLAAGMVDDAERVAAKAIALSEECADPVRASIARRHAAAAAAAKGDAARAKEMIERAVKDLEATDAKLELARTLVVRAELLRGAGDGAGAEKDDAKARELFERCGAKRELARLSAPA